MVKQLSILLCCVLIITATACQKTEVPLTAAELLDLGEKYLLDLNYEQALVQFLKVIEIEPMNARAYLAAAEVYLAIGDEDKAIAILQQGLNQLQNNADIKTKLNALSNDKLNRGSIYSLGTFDFDSWRPFSEGRLGVSQNNKWGYIDRTGKIVIPIEYDSINNFSNGVAIVTKGEQYGLIDLNGNMVLPVEYSFITFRDNYGHIYKERQDDSILKPGVIDLQGNIIIPSGVHDFIGDFNDGLALVRNDNNGTRYGFVDMSGNIVVPIIYVQASDFSEGLAVIDREVLSDGLSERQSAVINTLGEFVISFGQFDYTILFGFKDGLALISSKEGYGYINTEGNILFKIDEHSFFGFREGLASMSRFYGDDLKYGFIDKSGNIVIPYEYDSADYFNNGIAIVKKGDYYGVIDKFNNVIIPFEYEFIQKNNHHDFLTLRKNGFYGILNKRGKILMPAEYDYIGNYYSDDLLLVSKNGKHGFVNEHFEFVIPLVFDRAGMFMNGYAKVWQDGKEGVINGQGEFVIPLGEYKSVNVVGDGFALVWDNNNWDIIELPFDISR